MPQWCLCSRLDLAVIPPARLLHGVPQFIVSLQVLLILLLHVNLPGVLDQLGEGALQHVEGVRGLGLVWWRGRCWRLGPPLPLGLTTPLLLLVLLPGGVLLLPLLPGRVLWPVLAVLLVILRVLPLLRGVGCLTIAVGRGRTVASWETKLVR